MISYPRVRMFFMLVGIVSTLYYTYEAIGVGLIMLGEFAEWLKVTFK